MGIELFYVRNITAICKCGRRTEATYSSNEEEPNAGIKALEGQTFPWTFDAIDPDNVIATCPDCVKKK